eukprot:3773568-Prymnesium_polylepis.1
MYLYPGTRIPGYESIGVSRLEGQQPSHGLRRHAPQVDAGADGGADGGAEGGGQRHSHGEERAPPPPL